VLRVLLSEFPPLRPCCPASAIRFAAGRSSTSLPPCRFDSIREGFRGMAAIRGARGTTLAAAGSLHSIL
jgi:hypothetical protein